MKTIKETFLIIVEEQLQGFIMFSQIIYNFLNGIGSKTLLGNFKESLKMFEF